MHDVSPRSANQRRAAPRSALQRHLKLRRDPRRFALLALGTVAVIVLLAWIDGGEEPLHSIAEPVALPQDLPSPRVAS